MSPLAKHSHSIVLEEQDIFIRHACRFFFLFFLVFRASEITNRFPICLNLFSLSLSLSAESYGFLPGEWKWGKRCLCYLRERKTQHKHMTMFRYGSTLPAGEIKCAFLFSGKRPHAAGAADGATGAAAAIMLHQNVIKRRSISNIRLILYHQTLIPT